MSKLSRRGFLKGAAALTAGAVAGGTGRAEARENKTLPPKAVGLLFDSTLCIGCKACVAGCKRANDMPLEQSTAENFWDTPLDISGKTLNVIKMYQQGTSEVRNREQNGFAFIKKSCLHCVDPSCVSACPVTAMHKDPETGIVSYNKDACIGCRYCVAACPFGVPRFQYDTATPQIQKCQLCKHLQAKGGIPECANVCPTGATLFGPVEKLKAEAKRRLALKEGELAQFQRRTVDSTTDVQERVAAKYIDRVYGEKEGGGTQMLMLSAVPFNKLGLPDLPDKSYASTSETIQGTLYGGMILPAVALGGLVFAAHKTAKEEE